MGRIRPGVAKRHNGIVCERLIVIDQVDSLIIIFSVQRPDQECPEFPPSVINLSQKFLTNTLVELRIVCSD